MITTYRSLLALMIMLIGPSAALAQTQPVHSQTPPPIVTATASTERVRYVSMGEVHQSRLQVFSSAGAQVYDTGFKLGNLIDWHLQDQQGTALTADSYLFLVTVKDFSNTLTQKYGSAVLEQGQVHLEQRSRGELSSPLVSALEGNQQAESLSAIDRIGATGANRTTPTVLTDGTTTTTNKSEMGGADATPADATGIGTQNYIAKWADGAGELGNSTIFEDSSGLVGIGTTDLTSKLQVVAPAVFGRERVARFGVSDDPNNYLAVENGGSTPAEFSASLVGQSALPNSGAINIQGRITPTADSASIAVFALDAYRTTLSPVMMRPILRIRNWDQELFKVLANGNVGIGMTAPSVKLHVNGNTLITPGNGYEIQFGTPNADVGMTLNRPASLGNPARADVRFNGTTLSLLAGVNNSAPCCGIVLDTAGNVSIGDPNPVATRRLYVAGGSNHGVYATVNGSAVSGVSGFNFANGPGVTGVSGGGGVGVTGFGSGAAGVGLRTFSDIGVLIDGYNNSGNRQFHIANNGTYVGGSDFAESLPTLGDKSHYEPGDVLVMSTQAAGSVEKSIRPYDTRVAGVYSTRPGMLGAGKGNETRVDPNEVPVAIVGIVPTKVSAENGFIRIGDLLTTSRAVGYAMRCEKRVKCIGAIVGKAMEPLKKRKGVIKVLVTLR